MTMDELSTRRRARTDEQKEERRQAILTAAEAHFAAVGFESFSMAVLAREVGIAKGTLYLYFATREEVLLAVFMERFQDLGSRLIANLGPDLDEADFCAEFYRQSVADPVFIGLTSRLESVIEHNISLDAFCTMKRAMAAEFERMVAVLTERLSLTADQAFDLLISFSVLLQGASQADAGPTLEEESLPADVRTMLGHFSGEALFVRNARRILAGVRAGI